MALVAKPLRGLFLGLFSAFTLFGTSMTIVGAALPKILGDFHWSYAAAGAVIAASAAAYFLGCLLAGKILKAIGAKATVLAGLAACVFGLAFFASSPSFLVNLLLNVLVGAGQGCIEPAINWSALRMDASGSGRAMNLMHGAFSIGAVAGPLVLGLIMATGLRWTLLFRAIAFLFAMIGIALAAMPFDRLGAMDSGSEIRIKGKRTIREPVFYLGFACLLLYVGAEIGISNWIAEYFVRIFSAGPAFASLTVSLFWIGVLAGRFGVPSLYRGQRQEIILVAFSLLLVAATVALCAIGFTAAGSPLWVPATFTFLAGLGCSIIYPTIISIVGVTCEKAQAEAISFAVAGGGSGLFAFPFLMSWISQGYGIKIGFASYAIIAALTAFSCSILAKVFAKGRKNRPEDGKLAAD
jgi:fucose permease